ncbi:MAG: uncharacterized protein QOC81_1966 [Thermoanaerobaculia bacterium]|jgi:short-subunit dehydrogenase|nr:uncharacterized protein [Thermoanaerobaculia bacterium]
MGRALITGASSGLGRDFAQVFSEDGHDIVLVARREERLTKLARDLEERYGTCVRVIVADLRKVDAVERLVAALSGVEIDYLVNNAGFGQIGGFATTDLNAEIGMIHLHIVATTQLTKLLLPPMLHRGRGRILNVASIAAFLPGPYAAVYYATKAYVLSWSEALAEELRDTAITVTTACPGRTATEFASVAGVPRAALLGRHVPSLPVARRVYRAMHRGQRLVVPGLVNKAVTWLVRLAPRSLLTRVTRAVQQRG